MKGAAAGASGNVSRYHHTAEICCQPRFLCTKVNWGQGLPTGMKIAAHLGISLRKANFNPIASAAVNVNRGSDPAS